MVSELQWFMLGVKAVQKRLELVCKALHLNLSSRVEAEPELHLDGQQHVCTELLVVVESHSQHFAKEFRVVCQQ